MGEDLADTLRQRGSTHGDFSHNADIAQTIKDIMRSTPNWAELPMAVREALDVIALKQSRILSGNWREPDHYHDGAGYFRLAEKAVRDI